jgi:hypothetical protein
MHACMVAGLLPERLSEREKRYDCSDCRNSNPSSAAAQPLHVFATGERVPRCLTYARERLRHGFPKRARGEIVDRTQRGFDDELVN